MWIGVPLGLYGDLKPEIFGTQGASENLQLMLTGQVTVSTGTQDIIFQSVAEGRQLAVTIPCVYLRGLIHRISVTPGSPIQSYSDLKGKTIGVPTLAYGGVGYLKFALQHAGISFDDVNLVAVGDGQQAAVALTSKRVDALLNADVDVVRLQSLGVDVEVLQPPATMKNATTAYVWAFAKPWYEANKKIAAELLKGLVRSIIFMTENPEAAVRISYYMYPQSIPSGVSREDAIKNAISIINARAPLLRRNSAQDDRWCSFSEENWRTFIEILGLKGKVDPLQYYTDELVDEVNTINEEALREWARGLQVPDNDSDIAGWLEGLKPPL
jgi:NitT/TauT family transport system substrate-binding protein